MNTILRTSSFLLVSHIYKWILPIATTILMLFFADKDRSFLIRFLLWFFSCVAYLSIPINFENPRKEAFSYFLKKNIVSTFVITILASTLSFGVFILTTLSVVMYFPQTGKLGILISTINGLLYFSTILIEYWLLPSKLQTQFREDGP